MGAAASQCCGRSAPERRICQRHIAILGHPLLGTLAMAQPCTLRPPIVYVNTVGSEIISRCPVVEASAALGGGVTPPVPRTLVCLQALSAYGTIVWRYSLRTTLLTVSPARRTSSCVPRPSQRVSLAVALASKTKSPLGHTCPFSPRPRRPWSSPRDGASVPRTR